MSNCIIITFPDSATKDRFAHWLSDGGEQVFFADQEIVAPDAPSLHFNYHGPVQKTASGKRKYGKWLEDDTIRVTEVS